MALSVCSMAISNSTHHTDTSHDLYSSILFSGNMLLQLCKTSNLGSKFKVSFMIVDI